jgi:hypothetical protein
MNEINSFRRTLLQVLQKCPVCATSEMLLELHNPQPALCSFIGNRYESTSLAPLDSHLRAPLTLLFPRPPWLEWL